MTIAVTGISGLVGQALWPYLERDLDVSRVIGIDVRPLPAGMSADKLSFHQLDMRAPQVEALLTGVDVLVHLAFVIFRSRKQKKQETDSINVQGTQTLCKAAARQGIRKLVFLSSVMAYGLHPDNPIPLTEDAPLRPNPDNFYSRAKGINERYLDRFVTAHPNLVVTRLRPCTIIGPHAPSKQMDLLTGDSTLVARGVEPPIQLVHEDDVAQAVHLTIGRDAPGAYNVGGDEPQRLSQLMQVHGGSVHALPFWLVRVLMEIGWRLGLSPLGAEYADLARYPALLNTDKLKALGWQPHYSTPQAFASLREKNL